MSVIIRDIKFAGSKGSMKLETLFDSGAGYSFIKKEFAISLGLIDKIPEHYQIETAVEGEFADIDERIGLDFYLDNIRLSDEFYIFDKFSEKAIIGASTMQKWRLELDFEEDKIYVDSRVTRLMLKL
ncbi:MAG: hypothetical protein QG635_24 [Bacteroidota bacterium]|nr:hypothetical protein [Bacteroidota bacterium]